MTSAPPKFLYHGSPFSLKGFIEPKQATDKSNPNNCQNAVYATERRDIALGMSLRAGEKHAGTGSFDQDQFVHIFMFGRPQDEPSYLYTLSGNSFEPAGPYQWVSFEKVEILETEVFQPSELDKYWRPGTTKEIEEFMKDNGISEL